MNWREGASGFVTGGLGGGLLGLFSDDLGLNGDEPQKYADPQAGRRSMLINQMMSSNLGAKRAQIQEGKIKQQADDQMKEVGNTPGLRNASVIGRVRDNVMRSASQASTEANLQGAEFDQDQKTKGIQLSEREREFDYNEYLRMEEARNQPGMFEQMATMAIGNIAGAATGAASAGIGSMVSGAFSEGSRQSDYTQLQSDGGYGTYDQGAQGAMLGRNAGRRAGGRSWF